MASINAWLSNFTAGEVSPWYYGRVDHEKYQNAARTVDNFIVKPYGGVQRRGGTRFIANFRQSAGYAGDQTRLIPFVFKNSQPYILEFSPYCIRVFKDQGQIYNADVTIGNITRGISTRIQTDLAHGFANGDRVIVHDCEGLLVLNNQEFQIAEKTATTFTLRTPFGDYVDTRASDDYAGGGSVSRLTEITSVYGYYDIADLAFCQSFDTLYIFSPWWPIHKLTRHSHTNWTLEAANIEEGPWLDMNIDNNNRVSIDVGDGYGVMTFMKTTLNAAHVGSLWRVWDATGGESFGYATWAPGAANIAVNNNTFWEYNGNVYNIVSGGGGIMSSNASYPKHTEGIVPIFYGTLGEVAQVRYEHSGYCVVQIDGVVDTQNAMVTVVKNWVPYTAYGARSSSQWQEGAWNDFRGYPRTGTFHEQRLCAASTDNEPTKVWGSRIGEYLNFRDGDKDDDSYNYAVGAGKADVIQYLCSSRKLMVLTSSSEHVLGASRADEVVTPTNVKASAETEYGAAHIPPVRAGPSLLFAQRQGDNTNPARKIREFSYQYANDQFVAPDLTILSEHITFPGLLDGAYQSSPDLMLWYARYDGDLVGMTYERDQRVVAWHHHTLGANVHNAPVMSLACIPGVDGDELWMLTARVVNGRAVGYIEMLQPGILQGEDVADGTFLDCSLSYLGPSAQVIGGLVHLEGETVSALADGQPVHGLLVTEGAVTLPRPASQVHIGYNFTSTLRTLRIEAGAQQGVAQGRRGRVHEVILRLDNTVGGKVGRDDDNLDPIEYRRPEDPFPETIPLFTGDKVLAFGGGWDRDRYLTIVQDEPLPMHIISLSVGMRVSG